MISIGNRLFYQVALVAIFIRAVLIVYGEWQDRNLEVKYTDVDYWVFSGAATAILNGKSPYVRHTYRYTPLLAMLLLPNDWIGPWWGKTLFCAFDIISGYLIYLFLLRATNPTRAAYITGGFWLLNVMTFTISSRGNAESILCTLIVAFLYYLTSGRTFVSGIVYGASIHLKIFPVIFGMAILSFLCSGKYRKSIDIPTSPRLATPQKSPELVPSSSPSPSGSPTLKNRKKFANELALQRPSSLATPNKIRHINVSSPSSRIRKIFIFGLGTLLGFGVLTGICYWLYGREFLQEAYFYHLTRKDHRHNFSPYFYLFYTEALLALPKGFELLVFIPQFLFFFLAGLKFGKKDLPFACFIITFVFVTFNKYFLWYLCLFPLAYARFPSISMMRWAIMAALWIGAQAAWLHYSFELEMLGREAYLSLWVSSLSFLLVNVWIAGQFIRNRFAREVLHAGPGIITLNSAVN